MGTTINNNLGVNNEASNGGTPTQSGATENQLVSVRNSLTLTNSQEGQTVQQQLNSQKNSSACNLATASSFNASSNRIDRQTVAQLPRSIQPNQSNPCITTDDNTILQILLQETVPQK